MWWDDQIYGKDFGRVLAHWYGSLISLMQQGEHITDIYITETGTTELENLSLNIIDIFTIET